MYNKTTWKTGDVITEDKLNHIENGISDIDSNKTTSSQASFASSPSSTSQSISVGASGSPFTAPCNGEILFGGTSTAVGNYIGLVNVSSQGSAIQIFYGPQEGAHISVRCSQGQTIRYNYSGATNLSLIAISNNGDV